tara:strand:- start:245 stop:427 length:183 start_codon:yes stop_codon:yes gene_type:complete
MVMHLKKEFNCFKFDTLDLPKEVKYEREIKLEFYKKLSSDSIEDLKRKKRPFHFGAFFFE